MKEKLILIGKEILFLLCVTIAAAAGALLQFVGKKFLAEDASFLFAGTAYRYNIFMYLLGLVLFVAFVWFAYAKHFKKTAEIFRKESTFMKFFYIVFAVALCMVQFVTLIGCDLLMLGLTDDVRPEALFYLTGFGWPAGMLVFMMVALWKHNPSSVAKGDSLSRLPARSLLNACHRHAATPKGEANDRKEKI